LLLLPLELVELGALVHAVGVSIDLLPVLGLPLLHLLEFAVVDALLVLVLTVLLFGNETMVLKDLLLLQRLLLLQVALLEGQQLADILEFRLLLGLQIGQIVLLVLPELLHAGRELLLLLLS
jgi:hypothetical protein